VRKFRHTPARRYTSDKQRNLQILSGAQRSSCIIAQPKMTGKRDAILAVLQYLVFVLHICTTMPGFHGGFGEHKREGDRHVSLVPPGQAAATLSRVFCSSEE
jgi:hypothetical protein